MIPVRPVVRRWFVRRAVCACLFSDRFQVLQSINRPCLKRPDDIRRITALVHVDTLFGGAVRSASLRSQSQTCPSACAAAQCASLLGRIHEPTPALKPLRSTARLSDPRVARYSARPLLNSGSRSAFEFRRRPEQDAAQRSPPSCLSGQESVGGQ